MLLGAPYCTVAFTYCSGDAARSVAIAHRRLRPRLFEFSARAADPGQLIQGSRGTGFPGTRRDGCKTEVYVGTPYIPRCKDAEGAKWVRDAKGRSKRRRWRRWWKRLGGRKAGWWHDGNQTSESEAGLHELQVASSQCRNQCRRSQRRSQCGSAYPRPLEPPLLYFNMTRAARGAVPIV